MLTTVTSVRTRTLADFELQLQEERMSLEHYHLSQFWDLHSQRMTDTRNEDNDAIKSAMQILRRNNNIVMETGFDEYAKQ
ncbi:hypothetical protein GN244_ATG01219 [Phytophthora infestans]|uniref:Uncharacterized protein n=1 Tax=Phytophthora infestans TaxID=4787 RepID=A0A833W894_PHYIN|nr:hypothetical protein GN244_ATG01219 [Phytophthora infestans]